MNIAKINDRYDAIDDLTEYMHEADSCRAKLSKLPDIEKLLAKIFSYSVKHKKKAIYFEDVSLIKLQEFRKLLEVFKGSRYVIDTLASKSNSFKSIRLR
jgi:DNA mismatch repair ATPase MutS